MYSADLLTILLDILVIALIAVCIYVFLILFEFHKTIRSSNNIIKRFESILGFVENKLLRTTANTAIYLGLMKEFFELVTGLKGKGKKKKKEEEDE